MSPGKAYVPESADLQLKLLRCSWAKKPYRTKTWGKFRRESPDRSSPYLYSGSIWGGTPPVSQHCFKSGDTKWASRLFPGNWAYFHWKPLPPGMQKAEGKSEICILLHEFWLKWWIEKALRQQQTPSSQKCCTARWQNRLGSHPALSPMAKAIRRSWRELITIQDNRRNIRESVTDQDNPLRSLPGRITVLWVCLAIPETGSPLSQGLCQGGMAVLPAPIWSSDGQKQCSQPCSSTPQALAEAVSDQAGKHQDRQPKREGCHHPHHSDVFYKAGWKYVPRASISQTQVPSSMAILTRFDSQKKPFS